MQETLRDCATNAPLGAPFNSLVSFHDGGTLSESAGSLAFAAGQRSPGHWYLDSRGQAEAGSEGRPRHEWAVDRPSVRFL